MPSRFPRATYTAVLLFVSLSAVLRPLPPSLHADEPPAGALFEPARDLRREFAAGQFTDLLDIHLLQYSADVSWHADWAQRRFQKNGLAFEAGSISARDLGGSLEIALNVPTGDSSMLRYDRRSFRDHRFEFTDERLEVHRYVLPWLAVVAAGMPASRKEHIRLGGGLHIGRPADSANLQLLVLNERPLYNLKHRASYVFSEPALRYFIDGHARRQHWRVFASASLGSRYEIENAGVLAPALVVSGQGRQHHGRGGAIWQKKGWQAGTELFAASNFAHRVSSQEAEGFTFDRRWMQAHVFGRRDWSRWSLKLLTGAAVQRDVFDFAQRRPGRYDMRIVLWGWESGWRPWRNHEFRLGYLANGYVMKRVSEKAPQTPIALLDRGARGYTDKVHLKWQHAFAPGAALELLVSHELMQGTFGGFSAKGIFFF